MEFFSIPKKDRVLLNKSSLIVSQKYQINAQNAG